MKQYATNGLYGKYGEYAPRYCAVTTLPLQSGAVTFALGNDYYMSVNPLAVHLVDESFKDKVRRALPINKPVRKTSDKDS